MGDRLGIRDAVGIILFSIAHLKLTNNTRLFFTLRRLVDHRKLLLQQQWKSTL